MDGMGAADRRRSGFRQAEMAHLALPDQFGHRCDGVFDRRLRIDTVLVIEIDSVDPKPHQARLAGVADIIRSTRHAEPLTVRAADIAELRGDHHGRSPPLDGAAHQLLVASNAIHVGGVEEGDAEIDRTMDGGDRFGLIADAVELRHSHAAEAHRRDAKSLSAESAVFHGEGS
jgi:hypothetical protein